MPSIPEQPVYLVTQHSVSAGRSTPAIVDAAIDAGVNIVQLREKGMSAQERYELGITLRERTAAAGIPLIVNDRVDLAAAINADGVHLGDEDLPVDIAREQLGSDAIIGRSVSTPQGARAAEQAGADYLGVGAIYQTDSKPDVDPEEHGIGLDRVTAIASTTDLPVVGIGGITPDRAPAVVNAGADGVAVISAITQATEPRTATARLAEAVRQRGVTQ